MTIQKRTVTGARGRRAKRPKQTAKNVWQKLIELGRSIPDEELARIPPDGARNADHYLHGSPKQD